MIYDDRGKGSNRDFSCYGPTTIAGYYVVGHFGTGNNYRGSKPKTYVMKVTGGDAENVFKIPLGYKKIWGDDGSGGVKNGSFWEVNCPTGYSSLSDLCQLGYSAPSVAETWCVNDYFLVNDYHDKWIWDDAGSGAYKDVDIYGGRSVHTKELVAATNSRGTKKYLRRIKDAFL